MTRYEQGDIVKIFDPRKSKGISHLLRRLCSGLSVHEGLQRPVRLPSGLKTCREDLSVNAREQDVAIPFFTHNSKTFVVAIDIFD